MLGNRQRYKAEARGGGSQGKQTAVACTQMFPSSTALPPLCPLFSHVVKPFIRDILSLCFFVTLGNFLENHPKKKKINSHDFQKSNNLRLCAGKIISWQKGNTVIVL